MSYEDIQQYVQDTQIEGSQVICTFLTPSGETVESSARIRKSDSIKGTLQRKTTRMVGNKAKREASRMVRGILGGGMMGRLGSSTVRSLMKDTGSQFQYTEEEKQEAILAAFEKVADLFEEPPTAEKKVEAGSQSTTETTLFPRTRKLLKSAPVKNPFEREVLARLLVQVANADGHIDEDEADYLQGVIGEEFGTVEELLQKEPVSAVEAGELGRRSKKTIYQLCWLTALTDGELRPAEEEVLTQLAEKLELRDRIHEKVAMEARMDVLQSRISLDISREDLFEEADYLGMDHESAEKCLIDLKKQKS
jgi:uncharacterized membrane protein YebE (DUF533 family)